MLEKWTGEVVGEMHIYKMTVKELAEEIGWSPEYLSAILNGKRKPKNAKKKVKQGLFRLTIRKDRREKGLSDDLEKLLSEQDEEYAEKLRCALGL